MSSVIIKGDTSGQIALSAPAVAGTNTLTLPTITGTISTLNSGTAVSASGTAVDFTGIPASVRRITVMFSGVSTNGTSIKQIQIGTSGGVETTDYLGSSVQLTGGASVNAAVFTTGYGIRSLLAADVLNGSIIISNITGNVWVAQGTLTDSSRFAGYLVAGSKSLSGVLDRIRITTVNGTDTFDAGSINILYE